MKFFIFQARKVMKNYSYVVRLVTADVKARTI